jgi:hypothetical protein
VNFVADTSLTFRQAKEKVLLACHEINAKLDLSYLRARKIELEPLCNYEAILAILKTATQHFNGLFADASGPQGLLDVQLEQANEYMVTR